MSKEKALEICENISRTLKTISPNNHRQHKTETYDIPKAKKSVLVKIRAKLIKKYNLEL